MPERAAGHLRVGDGDQNAAADVAHEVDQARDLVALFPGHAHVGRRGDGDEAEGNRHHLNDAQPGRGGKSHVERGHVSRVTEGDDKQYEADNSEIARGNLAGGIAGDGHDKEQHHAARGQRQSGGGRVPSQQLLHELRLQDGVRVQHAAHQSHQETTDGEVFIAEEPQVDDGILVAQLPPDQSDHAADKEEGEEADEAGCEPGIFFALVEHDLQAAHGNGEEAEAKVVHVAQARAVGLDPRRIIDQSADQKEGQNADRNVDEEDPAPGIIIGDPTAEGGADRGREDGDETVEGKGLASLLRLEAVGHDGLGHGLHSAAAGSLQDAADEQHGQRRRRAAEEAGDGKNHNAKQEEVAAAHHAGSPCADGQYDCVRDQVAGQHPCALVGRSAQRAGDVGQGHVGDGGVEHFHECGQRHSCGYDPGVDAGLPERAGAIRIFNGRRALLWGGELHTSG